MIGMVVIPFGAGLEAAEMMNQRITRRLVSGLLAVAGVAALAVYIFPVWQYIVADPIEKVEIDTRYKLAQYERTRDARPLREWLEHQDAAFFSAAMSTLGKWAMHHQEEFLAFLDSLDAKESSRFAEGFGFVLTDFGMDAEFRRAFRGCKSRKLSAVLSFMPVPVPGHES